MLAKGILMVFERLKSWIRLIIHIKQAFVAIKKLVMFHLVI